MRESGGRMVIYDLGAGTDPVRRPGGRPAGRDAYCHRLPNCSTGTRRRNPAATYRLACSYFIS